MKERSYPFFEDKYVWFAIRKQSQNAKGTTPLEINNTDSVQQNMI